MMDSVIEDLVEHGWAIMPGFLPPTLVSQLAKEAELLYLSGKLTPAGTGQGEYREIRREIRGDAIYWLDASAATAAQLDYLARMESLRRRINRDLQLGLFDLEAHFARYPTGSFYRKHVDVFRSDARRTLSVICYLNHDWRPEEGGQLRLYPNEKAAPVDVLPTGGTLACFLSTKMPHEVLPATRPRLSLTGWFKRR